MTTTDLPTAPGTVIEAAVRGQRVRLMRRDDGLWISPVGMLIAGYLMDWSFSDDEISDWTVLLAGVES